MAAFFIHIPYIVDKTAVPTAPGIPKTAETINVNILRAAENPKKPEHSFNMRRLEIPAAADLPNVFRLSLPLTQLTTTTSPANVNIIMSITEMLSILSCPFNVVFAGKGTSEPFFFCLL